MERLKENMVLKGMNNVHSGLGILLGAGRISADTYEQILALLSDDDKNSGTSSRAGHPAGDKVPSPASWQSDNKQVHQADQDPEISLIDLQHGMNNMAVVDRSSGRRKPSSFASDGAVSAAEAAQSPDSISKIVCPWFLIPGYRCREQEKGRCAWVHEEIPDGTRDPLICQFWAENRCNKREGECQFAHYWVLHGQFARVPGTKPKKEMKKSSLEWR